MPTITPTPVGPQFAGLYTILNGSKQNPSTLLVTSQLATGDPGDPDGPVPTTGLVSVLIAVAVDSYLLSAFPANTDGFGLWFKFYVRKNNTTGTNIYKGALLVQCSCSISTGLSSIFGTSKGIYPGSNLFNMQWPGGAGYYLTGWMEYDSTTTAGGPITFNAISPTITLSAAAPPVQPFKGAPPQVLIQLRQKK